MALTGLCRTTGMGILPHSNPDAAFQLVLGTDIPFWPQLPKTSFYEDMYAQVTEHFPGIRLDLEKERVLFDSERFSEDLGSFAEVMEDPATYRLEPPYSTVYRRFLSLDLAGYPAIHGQSIGPVSFGLRIFDEEKKPIIYRDDVREIIFDFIARKVNVQRQELLSKNENAFVWLDEPGLEMLFASYTGYPSEQAAQDYRLFFEQIEGPRGIHLCGNPDWSFLLRDLDLDILSADTYSNGYILTRYPEAINAFLERGGIISWGIAPTLTEELSVETLDSLTVRLEEFWDYLAGQGLDRGMILRGAWLAPAKCCLINEDGSGSVERSYEILRGISQRLRDKYDLA